nr:hypothetical protein [Tanacetum cinerariifolium]
MLHQINITIIKKISFKFYSCKMSSISLVILSNTEPVAALVVIPADILAVLLDAPEAKAADVALPAGVLDLVIHSTLETDAVEDLLSSDHAPAVSIISPILSSDHSKLDSESEPSEDASESVATTPVILAPSIKDTVAPSIVPIVPTHDIPALVTGTTPTSCLTGGCNRVTAKNKVRVYKPVMTHIAQPEPLPSSLERRRSATTLVPAVAHPPGALSPVRANLLPPRKRFRSSATAPSNEYIIKDSLEAEGGTKVEVESDVEPAIEADIKLAIKPAIKRLEEIEEEQRVQGERVDVAVLERIALRARVKSLEIRRSTSCFKSTGIFDSGFSWHMTRNKSFLPDYQEYDEGFVAFAGSSKGGAAVLIGLAVLTGAAALEELCLAVVIGTIPDLVKTIVGANFLLELEKF